LRSKKAGLARKRAFTGSIYYIFQRSILACIQDCLFNWQESVHWIIRNMHTMLPETYKQARSRTDAPRLDCKAICKRQLTINICMWHLIRKDLRKRFNKGNNRAATWLSTLDAEQ
jgi:hypothetical protein